MKIMSNRRYDLICELVMEQKKHIERKEAEIKRLKAQVERLSYLMDQELSADSIDFPNSNKSYEDKLF